MKNNKDVIIVGGGVVGLLTAFCLSKTKKNILLIEQSINVYAISKEDNRSFALSYPTITFFKNIGIWNDILRSCEKIKSVHISKKGKFGTVLLESSTEDLDYLGVVVPLYNLNFVLINKIKELKNIKILAPEKVSNIDLIDDKYFLNISNEKITADLILACDGANSLIRKDLNINSKQKDYKQVAISCTFNIKSSHNNIAYERFLDDGVIAMLPLAGNKVSCIWTIHPNKLDDIYKLTDIEFIQKIQKVFGTRLGLFSNVSKRVSFPLALTMPEKLYKKNILLFGNASHLLHPVSGQGFNLCVRDIAWLYNFFITKNNSNLFEFYSKNRIVDQKSTALITDSLLKMFASDKKINKILINLGIQALARNIFLQKKISKTMMGKNFKLPNIML